MENKMLSDAEENEMRLALARAVEHFEVLAVILACPMTDEERELSYQQAEESAEMCRKVLDKNKEGWPNKKETT